VGEEDSKHGGRPVEEPESQSNRQEETAMRDVAFETGNVKTARLLRELSEREARERNALSATKPGLSLKAGDVVTVVETFDAGSSFLVEFNKGGKAKKDSCDWMGVVSLSEIEVVDVAAKK
jgi:hypothetical protein